MSAPVQRDKLPVEPPKVPASDSPEELGFWKQPMVAWFSLSQLIDTGIKVLLSGIFGAYEDKREIQALVPASTPPDYSDAEEGLWIDYLADTGDGWNPTYTMAYFAAQPQIQMRTPQGKTLVKPRGQFLVLGGDEVYPTSSRENYRDRLVGPFRSALPFSRPDEEPDLYAIPGNHDWYDGLTSFTRLFAQQRWIGGWRTRQSRSYFAIKLPHGWWLWGIDIQLKSDVDLSQLHFFKDIAKNKMEPGNKVILCTAEPSWAHQWLSDGGEFNNLGFLERTIIREHGLVLPVTLSGDLHHYSRYQRDDAGLQRITAGGGGAFLHSTENLPAKGSLQEGASGQNQYTRKAVFPSQTVSKILAMKSFFFLKNGKSYAGFLGFLYLLLVWFLESSSSRFGESIMTQVHSLHLGPLGILRTLGKVFSVALEDLSLKLAYNPALILLVLVYFGVTVALASAKKPWVKYLVAGGHALFHMGAALVLMAISLTINFALLNLSPLHGLHVFLFSGFIALVGTIVSGTIMGAYFYICSLFKNQLASIFSSIGIEDYKNMLKLHIDSQGRLTIYPIGVEKVGRNWALNRGAKPGESWFKEKGGDLDKRPTLIEDPIRYDPETGKWNSLSQAEYSEISPELKSNPVIV